MNVIAIASIVSVVGSVAAVVLVHKLVGFRSVGSQLGEGSIAEGPGSTSAPAGDLANQVMQLQVEMERLGEQIRDRDASGEMQWRMLEEAGEEIKQLRAMVRRLGYELHKRLRDSDESRQRRERELERRQERELERHRERELEQSRWHTGKDRPFASAR